MKYRKMKYRKVWKPQSKILQNEIPTAKYKNRKTKYRKVWKLQSMKTAKYENRKVKYRKMKT